LLHAVLSHCDKLPCRVQPVRLGRWLWRQPGLRQHCESVRDQTSNVHSIVARRQRTRGWESNVSGQHVGNENCCVRYHWAAEGNFTRSRPAACRLIV